MLAVKMPVTGGQGPARHGRPAPLLSEARGLGQCISKFGKKLRRLPIPQLIALITFACNQAGSIVPSCKRLQFTCNAWGNCNLGLKIVTALQVLVTLDNYCSKVQSNDN